MASDELRYADEYGTWSGILELLSSAMSTYEYRYTEHARPEEVADRMRTIARALHAAATEVREDELMRLRAA